ncbi:hypothetical protein PISMIDRAFT_129366 [Pisolithus microcarpus 441]|uniref:Uncharacterized protein n=1 Tax=Pisolithus microcarpus 441 TaxID=765257 RepID=A0A0D0A9T3_9AGAM|nr:hypothetical protein PISMIDRAFT_129366 [Pisolithus microcarpus 441]
MPRAGLVPSSRALATRARIIWSSASSGLPTRAVARLPPREYSRGCESLRTVDSEEDHHLAMQMTHRVALQACPPVQVIVLVSTAAPRSGRTHLVCHCSLSKFITPKYIASSWDNRRVRSALAIEAHAPDRLRRFPVTPTAYQSNPAQKKSHYHPCKESS